MATNFWSSIENINNWRLWIWKNKWGYGSGKTNSFSSLINEQPDIDKICLYAEDPNEANYQFLINKKKSIILKHLNDYIAFIEYSNNMGKIYKNIEECNPNKKRKY